jgi:hypothetical protein
MPYPDAPRYLRLGHVRDGGVRNAEEDKIGVVRVDHDASLAQARHDGRAHPARTDDVDSLDHDLAPAPNGMPGSDDSTDRPSRNAHG